MARPSLLFLGPVGSFTHAGALTVPDVEPVPARSAREIVTAVQAGEADLGLVPLENSVEGDVPGTLDELVFGCSSVFIRREVVVPVTFVLAALPGATVAGLTTVTSHPHAVAQCRRVVAELGLDVELAGSTSQACADVAAGSSTAVAALASLQGAQAHGLQVLRSAVEDVPGARTRFALLGRTLAPPSGQDVTLAVLTPDTNRTGVLVEALRCFSDRGVALSRVSSRPLKAQLGTYCFVVAAQGHLADDVVADALAAVAALGVAVKVLGSCPETSPVLGMEVGASLPPGSVGAAEWERWRREVLSASS